mmetsp:Transcript_46398/g.119735  ORF Transcript_46398/g.119735 Transcript_46398/m.119735 type:complete len:127 (-) Transcript_46398:768-1148(-)
MSPLLDFMPSGYINHACSPSHLLPLPPSIFPTSNFQPYFLPLTPPFSLSFPLTYRPTAAARCSMPHLLLPSLFAFLPAIGFALFIAIDAGGDVTGGYVNPARMLGPAFAFGCNLDRSWVYILAEVS